jgi:hypothetical protein
MDATGGWPILLDEALNRALRGRRVPAICKGIQEEVTSGTLRTDLLNGLGLAEATDVRDLLTELAAFDEPSSSPPADPRLRRPANLSARPSPDPVPCGSSASGGRCSVTREPPR